MQKGLLILLFFSFSNRINAQTILYAVPGFAYSQNFDNLPATGTFTITGDGPLEFTTGNNFGGNIIGWYLQKYGGAGTNISWSPDDGASNIGSAYSYGTGTNADRALGIVSSGTKQHRFGALFTNNTGVTLDNFTITFYTEKWRRGDNVAGNITPFSYKLGATAINDGTGFVPVTNLDIVTPNLSAPVNSSADGNAASNRTLVTFTVSGIIWSPAQILAIRWTDPDETANDDGLGIDDFTFSANFTPTSTDYFRSVSSGNWNNISTWESSTDNITWVPATAIPTSAANTITIRNPHTITIATNTSADQLTIETGGTLIHNVGIDFSLNDNISGTDMVVQGTYVLNGTQPSGSGTIQIQNGGLVRVDANAGAANSDNFAYENTNVSFQTGSTYQWATTSTPSWSNRTYFTTGQNVIFRFTATPSLGLGGDNPTVINGTLQADVDITFSYTGNKTFVNGITGIGNISSNITNPFSGNIIINGTTAILGGTGILDLPPSPSVLEIGSAGGTTVNLTSNKLIDGSINLLSTNTYIDLGTDTLTVTDTIKGGSLTSYIKTSGIGRLQLNNVGLLGKDFPIGHLKFNPLKIENGSNHDWIVSVYDSITADPPHGTTGAVQVTWDIKPSVNPPLTSADISFFFDSTTQVGPNFNVLPYKLEGLQAWHRRDTFYWLAAGVPAPVVTVNGNFCSVKVLGLTEFCPYALSRISLPLPINLIAFTVTRVLSNQAYLTWELATICSKDARFEIQKSRDNRNFANLTTVPGNENSRFYSYIDTRLEKGITYYRLKMTDADSKITFSKVVAIINEEKGILVTSLSPNPVVNEAVLNISSAKSGTIQLAIYDLSGRIIRQWTDKVGEGNNLVHFNTSKLAGGIYLLSVQSDENRSVFRFVKQ